MDDFVEYIDDVIDVKPGSIVFIRLKKRLTQSRVTQLVTDISKICKDRNVTPHFSRGEFQIEAIIDGEKDKING